MFKAMMTSHGTDNQQGFKPRFCYPLRNNCDYMNVYRELSHDRKVRNKPLSFSQIAFKMLCSAFCLLQMFLGFYRKDLFLKKPGAWFLAGTSQYCCNEWKTGVWCNTLSMFMCHFAVPKALIKSPNGFRRCFIGLDLWGQILFSPKAFLSYCLTISRKEFIWQWRISKDESYWICLLYQVFSPFSA